MLDIHAHILPGVDDGPATWDEALDIVRAAARDGVTGIVATSHMFPDGPFENDAGSLLTLVDELRRRVDAAGLRVGVYAGGEVRISPDVVERLRSGRALTYCNAGRYVLLEMPTTEIPLYTRDVLFELQLEGITPILAHPERNDAVVREPRRLADLVSRGALVQMTASSYETRGSIGETARLLLRHGLVHFVATDAHDTTRRPPELRRHMASLGGGRPAGRAGGRAAARTGGDAFARLMRTHAERVIRGEPLPLQPPGRTGRRGAYTTRPSDRPVDLLKAMIHRGQALLSK